MSNSTSGGGGGASLLGGRGSAWGALAGANLIKLIENGGC